MPNENVDPAEMRAILDTDPGERRIAAYLRENPWIPYWTFCPLSGHDRYTFAEFPLGSQYKVDLVLLNSYSGAWEAHFIELEPVGDPIFTKSRTPSERLAVATRQVDDWRGYIEQYHESVRRELVRWATRKDLLGYSDGDEPCNYSGDYLADPDTVIFFRYRIIIGRSSRLGKERRNLAGRYHPNHWIEVATYDRLLYLAERRYGEHRPGDPHFAIDHPM